MNQPKKNRRLRELTDHGIRATLFGIVTSALLGAVKIIAGIVGHSYALIADGIESVLDILSSFAVLGGLKAAATPPTRRYPFGYGKAEPLAALVVATALLAAAAGIAILSVREILDPGRAPAAFTLVVLVGVVLTKEMLFRKLQKAGEKLQSTAVMTDAWHHRADAITSVAAFIGISIALIGGEGYEVADDWAALVACAIIAFNGYRLARAGIREIIDVAPSPEVDQRVRSIASGVEGVIGLDKCRIRKSGLVTFIDIHVVVDGEITVEEGHRISHDVKDALLASELVVQDVTVHIEPPSELESKSKGS
jgi:cation diffusion facilitator family transporter